MGLSKLTDDELERIAYGRFRWEADIIARVGPAGRVAIDPKLTSSFQRPYQRWNFTTRTGVWLIEIGQKHFPRSLADAGDLLQVLIKINGAQKHDGGPKRPPEAESL